MHSKKWIRIWLVLVASALPVAWFINYIVDPFNVFQSGFLKYTFQVNERFLRIEHLKNNPDKYNGYLLGSSRIGTTHPETVEHYLDESKFYNLTIPSANLYDHLMHVKYLIDEEFPLKHLYLQIDIDNMSFYGRMQSDYVRKMHPEVVNESRTMFYLDYLSGFFPFNIKRKLRCNRKKENYIDYELQTTGIWSRPDKELQAQNDCEDYVANEASFHEYRIRNVAGPDIGKNIEALQQIRDLCQTNGIKLYVFTMPHNQSMMDTFKVKDYLQFLKALAKVTDYYDFSGYNSVTQNNCHYYEWSHYRPHVAHWIAGRIFNDTTAEIPNDFGVLVNSDNIEEHIENRRMEIEKRDAHIQKGK